MDEKMTVCPSCRGDVYEGKTIFTAEVGGGILLIQDVPSDICSQCGEKWFSNNVMDKIELIAADVRKRHVSIEVMNFNAA